MKIAAAILTYNRLELLKKSLRSIKNQSIDIDDVIIVNNGSTDGTEEWLLEQEDIHIVTQPNVGAAGGFYTAIKEGIKRNNDWIYCLDDDVIPHENAIEKITKNTHIFKKETGFICSRVVNPENRTYMTPKPIQKFPLWYESIANSMSVKVANATFAGFMINNEAVRKFGLPIKEFFIWEDDREYSERIARKMPCYCVINSVVTHFQGTVGGNFKIKKLYQSRNRFARIIISDINRKMKVYYISKYIIWLIYSIIFKYYPIESIVWAMRGLLLFRPKIEFPD